MPFWPIDCIRLFLQKGRFVMHFYVLYFFPGAFNALLESCQIWGERDGKWHEANVPWRLWIGAHQPLVPIYRFVQCSTAVLGVGSMDGASGMCCFQATLQMGGCSCQRVCLSWARTPLKAGRGCPTLNWWWRSPPCSSPLSWSPERTWRVSWWNTVFTAIAT